MAVTSTTKQVCSVAEELLNSFMNSERERPEVHLEICLYILFI